jgi:hypothetical protein
MPLSVGVTAEAVTGRQWWNWPLRVADLARVVHENVALTGRTGDADCARSAENLFALSGIDPQQLAAQDVRTARRTVEVSPPFDVCAALPALRIGAASLVGRIQAPAALCQNDARDDCAEQEQNEVAEER